MYSIWERLKAGIEEILRTRVFVLIIVFCIMSSILVGRLFNLQIVNGQQYLDDYKLQIQKTRVTQGTRGNIYDKNGKLLAYNELAYSVTIEDNYSDSTDKNKELNKEITKIINRLHDSCNCLVTDIFCYSNRDIFLVTVQSNRITDRYQF